MPHCTTSAATLSDQDTPFGHHLVADYLLFVIAQLAARDKMVQQRANVRGQVFGVLCHKHSLLFSIPLLFVA
jgi:hypothetical protein